MEGEVTRRSSIGQTRYAVGRGGSREVAVVGGPPYGGAAPPAQGVRLHINYDTFPDWIYPVVRHAVVGGDARPRAWPATSDPSVIRPTDAHIKR